MIDNYDNIPSADRVCRNCVHWNPAAAALRYGVPGSAGLGICEADAIEPDAGKGAVVLLGPRSHCQCHAQAWEPDEGYLIELADDWLRQENPARYLGLRPGEDFPATL